MQGEGIRVVWVVHHCKVRVRRYGRAYWEMLPKNVSRNLLLKMTVPAEVLAEAVTTLKPVFKG